MQSLFKNRLLRAEKQLAKAKIDALLIKDPTTLYYFTGQSLTTGFLLITPTSSNLIVDGRYYEGIKNKTPCKTSLGQDLEGAFIEHLCHLKPTPQKIGFLGERLAWAEFERLKKRVKAFYSPKWIEADPLVATFRQLKDANELAKMSYSAKWAAKGTLFVKSLLREGIKEIEIAKELEKYWLTQGADGLSFPSIIAFGENSAMPHYRAGATPLKKGDVVQVDIGVTFDHYCSDISRVFFFGTPPKELKKIYEVVEKAQLAAIAACKAGIAVKALDAIAREFIEKAGYGDRFVHSLGHGVGLEVHEPPFLRKTAKDNVLLEEGMVITIEPGIYVPGLGGVRIEDTVLVTKKGCQILTSTAP